METPLVSILFFVWYSIDTVISSRRQFSSMRREEKKMICIRIRIRYLISSEEECSDVIGYYISPIGSRYLCPIMPRIPFWRMAAGCGFTGDIWIEGLARGGGRGVGYRDDFEVSATDTETDIENGNQSRASGATRREYIHIYIYVYTWFPCASTLVWKWVLAIPRLVN